MEEKIKLFEAFDDVSSIFSEVNDEWTTACFDDNFSDFSNFAQTIQFSVLQAFDYLNRLSELCSRLLLYAQKTNSSTELWHEMLERNFDAKKLCVFAWYLIERGQQPDVVLDDRKIGLIGSRLYVSLCCLNGAQAFSIFNDYLFQRALDELQLIRRLLSNSHLPTTNRVEAFRNTKTKTKKLFVSNNSRINQKDFEQLTLEDGTELRCMLCDVLDSLFVFLNKGLLSRSQQYLVSLAVFLQQLMQLDFSEKTFFLECKRLSDFQRLHGFSDRSFALMHRFLDNRHAVSGVLYGRIVMPRLLFWTLENTVFPTNAHPPKLMSTYKEIMLNFIRIRVKKGSEEETSTILLMLQNICFRCPDRSDYRTKVASSVIEVLACLPPEYIQDFATFLLLIGSNLKVAVRGFAVEVAVPFIRQHGHVFEVIYEEDKKRYGCTEMDNKDVFSDKEVSMELDEIKENDNDKNTQIRRKAKKKRVMSDNLIRKIGFHNAILVFLLRSCNDKSPVLRTRALMQIAALLNDESMRDKLLNLPKTSVHVYGFEDEDNEMHQNVAAVLRIIATRCSDARVSTRRAALVALESIFSSLSESQKIEFTSIFQQHCRDPSLLVRKQAAESLTRLLLSLHTTNNSMFDKAWLTSVLPLINDREQSVVQLTSKLVLETIILPALENTMPFVWRILEAVEQEVNHRRLLLRCLLHQAREGGLTEHAVESLLNKCDDLKNMNIVWMLMSFLSRVFKFDGCHAVRFWYTLNESDESNLVGYVAEIIARCVDRISEESRNQLIEDFSKKLIQFSINESHIAPVYYAFARLCKGIGEDGTGAKELLEFNRTLMDKSLKIIHNIIFLPIDGCSGTPLSQENDKTAKLLVRIINLLGEAIQYSPILLSANPKAFDIMQLIMASDVIQQQLIQSGTLCNTLPAVPSVHPSTAIHCSDVEGFMKQKRRKIDVQQDADCKVNWASATDFLRSSKSSGHENKVEGSQKTPTFVNQEYGTSQPTSHGLGPTFLGQHAVNMEVLSPAVRAQAVLAIGKMCLQDEKLAKKCVPVLSRQLLVNSSHLVRSNIVGVICDLCKRYTLLVERHSAIVASCLKDPSTLVRKQTLMLLTHLIKEQFVRWAGQIMYRFVSTILDENKEVREYAEMCLVDVLLVQFPNMFVNHFLECVFYFNSVTHSLWLATNYAMEEDTTERQNLKCSLSGFRLKNARMRLYRFMIKTFNDENKFTIGTRIGQEVYSAIVDGELDIRDFCVKALLEDCYEIMCCPEMKLSMALGKRSSNEMDDDDDEEPPSGVQEAARKVVTQAFRKGIIDAILPHIIQLKYYLQEKRLPELEFGIIRVLRELCKDHREQLDEFLASDKQLKAEIKFDLEKLEEKEKKMKIQSNNDVVVKIPLLQNRRVSFAIDGVASSPRLRPEKCEVGMVSQSKLQKNERNDQDGVPPIDSHDESDRKMVEEQMQIYDKEEDIEDVQPSTSNKRTDPECDPCDDRKVKRRSQRIEFEQMDEGSELPMRAISTPQHHIDELTFGLGDEMSAIEITPTRKRSKRQARQFNASPIEEADNENG